MSDKATLKRLLREHEEANRTEKAIIAEEAIMKLFESIRSEYDADTAALRARAEKAEAALKALYEACMYVC